MIKYATFAGIAVLLILLSAIFVINKIEESAVLKNELQEANDDERRDKKELEIASRPDDTAVDLLKRMRREEN